MSHDLVLEGKTIINNSIESCCIGIDDGKISSIKKILHGDQKKRFSKQLILPAGIDIHVHFRDPGMTHKETFETGSTAAAYGGVSCVFDMPNTIPPTTTLSRLKDKNTHAKHHSLVDFGLYAGITNENISTLPTFLSYCNGFKVFLGDTTGSFAIDPTLLPSLFQHLKHRYKPVLFHAEDNRCLQLFQSKEHHLFQHHKNRPTECEKRAIEQILSASQNSTVPIHICHLSSKQGLQLLENKAKHVSCGSTPHHLLLSLNKNEKKQTYFKVNPPIRPREHSTQLFQAIKQGHIDILESDHAPHTLLEKEQIFEQAPSGIPGVETMIPLFLSLAKHQHLSFFRLMDICCKNPADLMGIPKGSISLGNDADLMIIDLRKETKIHSEQLHSKAQWTPFEGWNAIFPSHVFLRGNQVIDEKELICSPGIGQPVKNR